MPSDEDLDEELSYHLDKLVEQNVAAGMDPGAARQAALASLEIQTRNLYTCSIGSFNIYTTVDKVDCATKTATVNYWMYNAMSRHSFGRFASHPAFRLSRMATQYMWWNWVESVDWSSGAVRTLPRAIAAGARRW
jgi:hypothetical protein